MSTTGSYLDESFALQKDELVRTRQRISKVATTFDKLLVDNQFPYEVKRNAPVEKLDGYSQSTNAMILFALATLAGRANKGSPLLPYGVLNPPEKVSTDSLKSSWTRLQTETSAYEKFELGGAGDTKISHISWSSSFGWDDPFTLTWLLELTRSGTFGDTIAGFQGRLERRARQRVGDVFSFQPGSRLATAALTWQPGSGLKPELLEELKKARKAPHGNTPLEHAFPILRFIHLQIVLEPSAEAVAFPAALADFLEGRLRSQLSNVDIVDGGFDASELVFALEGLLLLNPDAVTIELLARVFQVIADTQTRNPYWRPIKPFVSTPQGHVLFPLSVETANSLLRCCALIERYRGVSYGFSRNVELFTRYAEWLHSRYREGTTKDGRAFAGWHSEHVHLHDGIHLWETSQVLLFLCHYAVMLDRHIARSAIGAANLAMSRPWKDNQESWHVAYWDSSDREPLAGSTPGSYWRAYDYARRHLIEPRPVPGTTDVEEASAARRQFSLLLYGPPGTGKTSFAEEVCRALKWPLITITPSDFIRGGESEIESRAKVIFDVLNAQSEAVVLFDEIDKMILDRNSTEYGSQADIFKFMTPSMLTKLAALRKLERVIFIVGTNYGEKIDAAIKRRGRFDMALPLLPPDAERRYRILGNLLAKQAGTKVELLAPDVSVDLREAARKVALMTYGELESLVDGSLKEIGLSKDASVIAKAVRKHAEQPAVQEISLQMYKPRFDHAGVKPFEEFLLLTYLRTEGHLELPTDEQVLVRKAVQERVGSSDLGAMAVENRKVIVDQKISEILRGDAQITSGLRREIDTMYQAPKGI
jgi:ATPase family associated with various cellular activities (AAA)